MSAAEVLRKWLEALEERDPDAAMSLVSDDGILEVPYPMPGRPARFEGKQVIGEVIGTVLGVLFSSFKLSEVEIFNTDNPEVAIATGHGDAILHNGDTYSQEYVFFVRVRNGLIVEYKEYFDPVRGNAALATLA
jgi:ketosteroid isomerase-like protein